MRASIVDDETLSRKSENRDPETGAHIERVQNYARLLAQQLSTTEAYRDIIDAEFIRLIFQTSPLHDIGKVAIPDNILLKPGQLTEPEMQIMRTHVMLGAQALDASLQRFPDARFLQMAREIVVGHHERWDGTGYPAGLRGVQTPLAARIVALADVYDAVTTCRIYRDAMPHAQARQLILRERGGHFDPDIVDAFLGAEARFITIKEQFREDERRAGLHEENTAARPQPPQADKVVIIDDDPATRERLLHFLHHAGYEATACAGAQALAELELQRPRLILCDGERPELDGLELCRRVRACMGTTHVHFILLTIPRGADEMEKAFAAGVDDFINKPFTDHELAARLRAGMRAVSLHDELSRQSQRSQQLNEQLSSLNHHFQNLVITDDLTGLHNSRQAMRRLEEHWALCNRYQRPVAVVALDIDHFKQVNDQLGHSAGDIVLKETADILRRCVRSTDIVCRVGGEEFLILLPCQTLHEAEICAHRCRQEVASHEFNCDGRKVRVTISAGIATRRSGMQLCSDMLKEADAALYAAKNSGRNAVRSAPVGPALQSPQAQARQPASEPKHAFPGTSPALLFGSSQFHDLMSHSQAAPDLSGTAKPAELAIAPASDDTAGPPIDLPSLRQRCLGNRKIAAKALSRFDGSMAQDLLALNESIQRRDAKAVAFSAHKIKSAAANVSANLLHRIAADLEKVAAADELAQTESYLDQLQSEMERFRQYLSTALAELTPGERANRQKQP